MASHDTIRKAAERLNRGHRPVDVARDLGVHPDTIHRWRREKPEMFEQHEEGGREHLRQVLIEALSSGSVGERVRAAEQLDRMGLEGGASPSVTVIVKDDNVPERCPSCGARVRPEDPDGALVVRSDLGHKPGHSPANPHEN
jgi:transposase-like protein